MKQKKPRNSHGGKVKTQTTKRRFAHERPETRGASVDCGAVQVRVAFYAERCARIVKRPAGSTDEPTPSLSVVAAPRRVPVSISETATQTTFASAALAVSVDRRTGRVSFSRADGPVLLAEKACGFEPVDYAPGPTCKARQSFQLAADEAVYGLGQQQNGKFSQRGGEVALLQGNTRVCIPLVQSSRGYGVFFDNASPGRFAERDGEMAFAFDDAACLDYYFLLGGSTDGVVREIRALTGAAPMLPLWALGFFQSRERYRSQEEYLDVLKTYRRLRVPIDGMIQDWQYWGEDNAQWNSTAFGNPRFPDPQAMFAEAHRLHAHTMISVWPAFGPRTQAARRFRKAGCLFDFETYPPNAGVRVYDAYSPAGRDIFWKLLAKLQSVGVDGWWLDATEPEHVSPRDGDLDQPTALGPFRRVRNAYPLMTTLGVYEHQRAATEAKRVVILTRSAFAGQQRTGANTWNGDVLATWENFRAQIPGALSLGLCGIPYWNSDIGGFLLDSFRDPLHNPEYHELYVRWMQFGCFTPMMRVHGTHAPRELHYYGKPGEPLFEALRRPIALRYALLPCLYAMMRDVNARDATMMRPLVADYPDDPQVRDLATEYLFGPSLLVAPVLKPMYSRGGVLDFERAGRHPVYLPAGGRFVDFWTGRAQAGGRTIHAAAPLDTIPLYVKAGAILPIAEPVQYAEQKPWKTLEIRVYPGADGAFTLYEDEGDGYGYEKGVCAEIDFRYEDATRALTIGARRRAFPGMAARRRFRIVKVAPGRGVGERFTAAPDAVVTYDGRERQVRLSRK